MQDVVCIHGDDQKRIGWNPVDQGRSRRHFSKGRKNHSGERKEDQNRAREEICHNILNKVPCVTNDTNYLSNCKFFL